MSPLEEALLKLDAATMALDLARLNLLERTRDAFPAEQAAVKHAENLVSCAEDDLKATIGLFGALKAGKSKVGYASYSPASKRLYAPPHEWRTELEIAGLSTLLPSVIMEVVNGDAVDELCLKSADFHKAVEGLIGEKLSAPVLRWRVYPPKEAR